METLQNLHKLQKVNNSSLSSTTNFGERYSLGEIYFYKSIIFIVSNHDVKLKVENGGGYECIFGLSTKI